MQKIQNIPTQLIPPQNLNSRGANWAISKTKNQIAAIQDQSLILSRLDELSASAGTREIQSFAYQAIRQNIATGNRSGVLKIPTWVGKTRIFANLLKVLQKNWLTLVPRVDLYSSTAREFREVGFRDHEIKFLHWEDWSNAGEKMLSLLTDPSINWDSGRIQCIMTYQALTNMVRQDVDIGEFIRSHFEVIIEDEAHRWLWDRTKEATWVLIDWEEGNWEWYEEWTWEWEVFDMQEDTVSLQEITEAEDALNLSSESSLKNRYNYKFTATPDLLGKSVAADGEYILYSTIEQAVCTRSIILPQYLDMGSAYTKSSELKSWKVADIESLAEGDNFIDETGNSIKTKIVETYISKKQEHWTLPAVAFASTIKHAEQIVAHMRERWIRAERVTSASSDISSEEAIRRMDTGDLDVIVTVTKVSEGFDYPPLACAMWFAPSLSSAKILQGNGRIMRYTEHKKPNTVLDTSNKIALSPNSYIIAPSIWYGGSNIHEDSDNTPHEWDDESADRERVQRQWKSPRIGNFYELLISQGELNRDMLSSDIEDILSLDSLVLCEVWEEVLVNGIQYIGFVTSSKTLLWVGRKIILNNIRKQWVQVIQGRQGNGHSIQLIPKSLVESLQVDKYYWIWEEIEIDWVLYIGVTEDKEVLGIMWKYLLYEARNQKIWIIVWKQRNGKTLKLIPKSLLEIEKTVPICENWGEIEINWIIYIGVTWTKEVLGLLGGSILAKAKKAKTQTLAWKQQNRYPIQLIPKSFIEQMKGWHKCEIGEEIDINGTSYVWVLSTVKKLQTYNLSGIKALIRAKEEGIGIITWRQINWRQISLVPRKFLEEIDWHLTCEIGEEVEINKVKYIGIIDWKSGIFRWVSCRRIIHAARSQSINVISARQKNGYSIQLLPKEFLESFWKIDTLFEKNWIKYTNGFCEIGEEVEINKVRYVGVTASYSWKWLSGYTVLRYLKKNPDIVTIQAKQNNGSSIQLVPIALIEELQIEYIIEVGEEKEFRGQLYIWVTPSFTFMGLKGRGIYRTALSRNIKILSGKQKNGFSIQLVPKEFIECLLKSV